MSALISFVHNYCLRVPDQIVMTPKGKTANSTTLMIERRKIKDEDEIKKNDAHIAGGMHQGIIINKTANTGVAGPKRFSIHLYTKKSHEK